MRGILGADGGWMPLTIRPQRYCDPVSLVFHTIALLSTSQLLICCRMGPGNNRWCVFLGNFDNNRNGVKNHLRIEKKVLSLEVPISSSKFTATFHGISFISSPFLLRVFSEFSCRSTSIFKSMFNSPYFTFFFKLCTSSLSQRI